MKNLLRRMIYHPLSAPLVARVLDSVAPCPRYLFVASTGRSGTKFITKLLNSIPSVRADHEAFPILHDGIMANANRGDTAELRRIYSSEKRLTLRKTARGAALYSDVSHIFIKSYAELAFADFGSRLELLHWRRDPIEVARSMTAIDSIPGRGTGNQWFLDPEADGNRLSFPALEPPRGYDGPFGRAVRCLWYWYEIEARTLEFTRAHPAVRYYQFNWAGTMDPDALQRLIQELGFEMSRERIESLSVQRVNRMQGRRQPGVEDAILHEAHHWLRERLAAEYGDPAWIQPFEPLTPADAQAPPHSR